MTGIAGGEELTIKRGRAHSSWWNYRGEQRQGKAGSLETGEEWVLGILSCFLAKSEAEWGLIIWQACGPLLNVLKCSTPSQHRFTRQP